MIGKETKLNIDKLQDPLANDVRTVRIIVTATDFDMCGDFNSISQFPS